MRSSVFFASLCFLFLIAAGCEDSSSITLGSQPSASDSKKNTGKKDSEDKKNNPAKTPDDSSDENDDDDDSDEKEDTGTPSDKGQNSNPDENNTDETLVPWLEDFECEESEAPSCEGNVVIQCKNNKYRYGDDCSRYPEKSICSDGYGCTACIPGTSYCSGDDVYQCTDDGSQNVKIKTCQIGKCDAGECYDDNCPKDAQFIYLVDTSYQLIKFDPGAPKGQNLTVLFQLKCSDSYSRPFSMAVDREANAWVLYNDSTLYKIKISDPHCERITNFQQNGSGLSTFGMAFSLDTVGGTTDSLFIGNMSSSGRFGRIDTSNMSYTPLAMFPFNYEKSPELTGTGLAKLYSFSPGQNQQHISEIDKKTGAVAIDYQLPGVGGNVGAWAFAHWGGYFFTFETVDGDNRIYRYDIETNQFELFLSNTDFRVVGAGVSTCAPTTKVN